MTVSRERYDLRQIVDLAREDLEHEATQLGSELTPALWLRVLHWLTRSYDAGRLGARSAPRAEIIEDSDNREKGK